MAHVSLYRRFRPDSFDKMVRQEHVVRILKNQIKNGAVGHAYLFTGPRGTGKTTAARIFARAINCESPVDGSPCGTCPTCAALGKSLDITEIDAASNNGVNEMRDLREKVQYPPVTGKYKVYIIDEVHMLTDSAFNALLKTLEEPPAHAVFILATTEPQKVPATILSRCMRLDFKLIPEEDLERHLMRVLDEIGKPYEREAVAAIARAGAGSDRDMLSIAETCIAYSDALTYESVTAALGAADFKELCALARCLLHADGGGALSRTEKILSEGKAVGVLVRDLLELLNRMLIAKTCAAAEQILSLPKDLFAEIRSLADEADGKAVLRAAEHFARVENDLKFTASPRILLETAILRVACPAQDYDIEALLVRMNRMEEELAALKKDAARAQTAAAPILPPQKSGNGATETVFYAPTEKEPTEPSEEDWGGFPEEEPIFEEAYFSDDPFLPAAVGSTAPAASQKPAPAGSTAPTVSQKPAPVGSTAPAASQTPAPVGLTAPAASQAPAPVKFTGDAQTAFGLFMRTLRKTSRSGVLFTMCSDLEAAFEGETLTLFSESETIVRSLKREDHAKIMEQVFHEIGISSYEVRLKDGKKAQDGGLEQLKRDFQDYPIEIK